jgi:SAM-dependent methyltransferase
LAPSSDGLVRAYYDRTASTYDAALDTPEARRHRRCFWHAVAPLLPPHARLLDFGAGTGLDAEHYAAAGHTVTAYDISPEMMAVLSQRCAAPIASGTVRPVVGTLDDLCRTVRGVPPFDAAVCNFAVFSLIRDLQPVFRALGAMVRPGGTVIVSIQNPWSRRDVASGAFWSALWSFARHGVMRYDSVDTGDVWRHLPVQVSRAARPEFRRLHRSHALAGDCRRSFGATGVFRLLTFERA